MSCQMGSVVGGNLRPSWNPLALLDFGSRESDTSRFKQCASANFLLHVDPLHLCKRPDCKSILDCWCLNGWYNCTMCWHAGIRRYSVPPSICADGNPQSSKIPFTSGPFAMQPNGNDKEAESRGGTGRMQDDIGVAIQLPAHHSCLGQERILGLDERHQTHVCYWKKTTQIPQSHNWPPHTFVDTLLSPGKKSV